MEKLNIKTPDDFIALMGHSLGFWPKESLVCILLDGRRIGASLRVNLPSPTTDTANYTDQLMHYITTDHQATGIVFGIFTHTPWNPGDPRPHEDMLDEFAGRLNAEGIKVRDGWYIGETTFTNYLRMGNGHPVQYHLDRITGSQLNAELVFRGSSIENSPGFHIPVTATADLSQKVLRNCCYPSRSLTMAALP